MYMERFDKQSHQTAWKWSIPRLGIISNMPESWWHTWLDEVGWYALLLTDTPDIQRGKRGSSTTREKELSFDGLITSNKFTPSSDEECCGAVGVSHGTLVSAATKDDVYDFSSSMEIVVRQEYSYFLGVSLRLLSLRPTMYQTWATDNTDKEIA